MGTGDIKRIVEEEDRGLKTSLLDPDIEQERVIRRVASEKRVLLASFRCSESRSTDSCLRGFGRVLQFRQSTYFCTDYVQAL